jgi:hypothetical protein
VSEDFVYLNPFLSNSVHESDIWAEEPATFADVPSIHREPFETLSRDLAAVARDPQHTTRVRFVVGRGGAGKSHLFSRLRRHVGSSAIFVFASNPPTRPSALLRWTLDKVVSGLRRPRLDGGKPTPYCQLEALMYLLILKENLGLTEEGLGSLHDFWTGLPDATREDHLRRVRERLVARHYEPQSLKGMLGVLRPETRETAFRWLSGSTNLLDEELAALGQGEPLEDKEGEELLSRLGFLSVLAGTPVVLVLDQLDLMLEPFQIDEFQRLLFTLIDHSRHWLVVIGLVEDNFLRWQNRLSDALATRLRAAGGGQLPTTGLTEIAERSEKEALLQSRLQAPALVALRHDQAIASTLHPLTDADLQALLDPVARSPRELLSDAAARYAQRALEGSGGTAPGGAPEPLDARLLAEFEERRARIDPGAMSVEKAALADRLNEVVQLVALAEGLGRVEMAVGSLEEDGSFKGTHAEHSVGGRHLHVVAHHIHRGSAFPSFLKKVGGLPPGTILVRDGAAGISGRATAHRLDEFRRDKHFVHLSRPAIADLYALGEVLAEMREGNFASLPTEPPSTEPNVLAALARQPWLKRHPFATLALECLRPGAPVSAVERDAVVPRPTAPRNARPQLGGTPASVETEERPPDLVGAIEDLMRGSRWLVLERLRLGLRRRHRLEVAISDLSAVVACPPLSERLIRYPRQVETPGEVQILIWNEEIGV